MSERTYVLEPRDLLFLRDARPMAASDAGRGANWPRPDQLWNAVINTFHRAWPERQPWEGAAHTKREGEKKDSSDRFGALKSIGPFPVELATGEVYYPCPLDLNMELVPCTGTNLPAPLTHAFRAKTLGKANLPAWLSASDYNRYLAGEVFTPAEQNLYDTERNIGVQIDPNTRATVKSQLYQAEYLRLRSGFALAFTASCDLRPKGGTGTVDAFEKLGSDTDLVLGGQQGVARFRTGKSEIFNFKSEISKSASSLLRWTLLAPALYNAGWRPDWVAPDGTVMLPRVGAERRDDEPREEWRRRVAMQPKFKARLVAARIGTAQAFSGWDLQTGPKPTQLAVSAGACYVFACADDAERVALTQALNPPNRRSALFGEKGFGLGICSTRKSEISNLKS